VKRTGTLASSPVPDNVKELYRTAPVISADHHVRMQAVFQKHIDNAVSKTVNLPEDADAKGSPSTGTIARKTRYFYGAARSVAMIS